MDSKTYTDWIRDYNRANDDFMHRYHDTNGNYFGGRDAWERSEEHRELMRRKPGKS